MKIIEEYNEFTWDMVRALPKCYYYHINNIEYKLKCKPSLSSLYYFVKNIEETNSFNPYNDQSTYGIDKPQFTKNEWVPPPIMNDYKNILKFDKEVVVIQNKYALEWLQGIFNTFDIPFLEKIFDTLSEKYQIIYIRPDENIPKYYYDDNKIHKFNDYEFIKEKYPNVVTIKDILLERSDLCYNTAQFAIHSTSKKHISVSGGNACLSAYFGGDLIIFDSKKGTGAGRGIWKTNSWLKYLSGSNIFGYNSYDDILNQIEKSWI